MKHLAYFRTGKSLSNMKKINGWRLLFWVLIIGMMLLEACSLLKPKCDCPKF